MSVVCHVCGVRRAPNDDGKCSECAAAAVAAWVEKRKKAGKR